MTKNAMNKVIEGAASKSKAMIELYNAGCEIKEIAEAMQVRYNFVYNVVSNYCRMNEVELRTNKENGHSKKAQIAELFAQGKSKYDTNTLIIFSYFIDVQKIVVSRMYTIFLQNMLFCVSFFPAIF